LKVSWIKRLLNDAEATWKNIPLFEFGLNEMNLDLLKCNCNYSNLNERCLRQLNGMSPFYHNLIVIWLNLKSVSNKTEIEELGQEIIWNNVCVQVSGKPLFFEDWIKAGFIKISDLFDNSNVFLSINEISKKVKKTGGIMLEYYALQLAVPKNWKKRIKKQDNIQTQFGLTHESTFYPLEKITSKLVRNIMVSKIIVKPICEKFWERKFHDHIFDWENIWSNLLRAIKEPRLITLNWKMLCNI
jgi:hypothetical protein